MSKFIPLESTERDIVIRVLRDNVFTLGNAGASLQAAVGDLAAQIPDAPNPQLRTEVTVSFCESQPWLRQGDHPLIDLIDMVRTVEPSIPAILKRLRSLPLPANPLGAEILDGGILFLGRQPLRDLLPLVWAPDGQCVLRINGDSKWGKSHSFRFLKFLNLQNMPFIPIKMENPGAATSAKVVAETLIKRMGVAPDDPPNLANETPLRTGMLLADWVLNLALRPPRNWWFVLDNFSDESLPDDTKEFIRQLATGIFDGQGRKTMRLVLINYKGQLPRELKRLEAEDVVPKDKAEWMRLVKTYYDRLAARLPAAKQPVAERARDRTLQELQSVSDAETDQRFMETLSEAVEGDTYELTAK